MTGAGDEGEEKEIVWESGQSLEEEPWLNLVTGG